MKQYTGECRSGMNSKAKLYISIVCTVGLLTALSGLSRWNSPDPVRFLTFLVLAVASSGLRVSLPSVPGTLSAVFVFQFLAVLQMTLSEALTIAWCATLAQNLWMAKTRPSLAQASFNLGTVTLSVQLAYDTYSVMRHLDGGWGLPLGLMGASLVAYFINTVTVATVIALVEGADPFGTWRRNYLWSFPYYLAGAALAGLISVASDKLGWQTSLLILPVVFLFYRSYSTYTGRLEDAKTHAEEVSALHLRTIESLALAIEAKDDTTHAHLRRVQTYALALGEELGLKGDDLAALRAAAILHDIGKLAVPEHIICKPGKLTHEEFEKMKIHPVVGAEILEHVKFPYPVAPIVLSHHEKWNGTGYPYGLKGEQIPIGARILATVDCLDALASDRQYRKALPIDDAMKVVVAESGKSFDPRIVDLLAQRYHELEKAAQAACTDIVKLSTHLKIERGDAPAAGFEASKAKVFSDGANSLRALSSMQSIAEARIEIQSLFELSSPKGHTLQLRESLALVASRLRGLIPHEAVVLWIRSGQHLEAYYADGANRALFESLRIPLGEGLAGWVAQNEKPILNGNPAVEAGYLNDPSKFTTLRAALAVPLVGPGEFSGVLAFYDGERDSFQKDHLRTLLGIASKLAASIEQSLARENGALQQPPVPALPTLESVLERFDGEIARCSRGSQPLAVLVCDIDQFRSWNDRFGSTIGDKILEEFGCGLRSMFREYDMVARMGGDEFAVVIPGIGPSDVQSRIRQMHVLAMQVGRDVSGIDDLTVTIGDSYFPQDGASVEELLSHADRKLFVAKRQKANRLAEAPAVTSPISRVNPVPVRERVPAVAS